MSQDGCLEVAWKGQAFPFLMHHPNGFHKTENYGSARANAGEHGHHAAPTYGPSSDTTTAAGTGTWNGPAPRGYIRNGVNTAAPPPSATGAAPTKEPETVRLASGQLLPLLGLGTFRITTPDHIKKALDLGYRHLDCATAYGNLAIVGQGIAAWVAAGGSRADLFISCKLAMTDRRPERVGPAVDKMLSELGCGYLDMLMMHWPEAQIPDSASHDFWGTLDVDSGVTVQQTWAEFEKAVDAGRVKSLAVSNFSLKQVEELLGSCRVKPAVNQVELTPLLPQRKLVGVCFRKGVQCMAYSPLGSGGQQQPNTLLAHPTLLRVAAETGKTPAQVLLRWNMQRGVPVVPKAGSLEHLEENIKGAFEWTLTSAQREVLNAMEDGTRFINPKWKDWGNPEEGGAVKPSLAMA